MDERAHVDVNSAAELEVFDTKPSQKELRDWMDDGNVLVEFNNGEAVRMTSLGEDIDSDEW